MDSQVVDIPNSNDYAIMIKENEDSKIHFNFIYNRRELYDLYSQMRAIFQESGEV